jgi:hypothetical protein
MKLNFYYKLYYVFLLLSGKRNSPNLTALALVSGFISLFFIWLLYLLFYFLNFYEIINYSELISGKKEYLKWALLTFLAVVFILNIFLIGLKISKIIIEVRKEFRLQTQLKKKRKYVIMVLIFMVFIYALLPGNLYSK